MTRRRQIALCSFGALLMAAALLWCIVLSYVHTIRLLGDWVWIWLASPAFYLYLYSCAMACGMSAGALLRSLPFIRAEDARTPVLISALAGNSALGFGLALFWMTLAWGCYPLFRDRQLRFIPFWPWPDWSWLEFLTLR